MDRTTLARANGLARSGSGRATIGEIDDDHLVQEVKSANGMYSETHTNEGSPLERVQPVGMTAVPLKQFEEEGGGQSGQQGGGQGQSGGQDQFNNNQPKGESAEAIMMYLGGSRSQRVALVDDRRVRPFKGKPGDAMLYHASGTEQKVYISDAGAHLIANNNASVEKGAQEKERYASLRHVSGPKQNRKIKKGEKPPDHPHEGKTVNCEVRCTKDRIEFRAGDEVFGFFDRNAKKWNFNGNEVENVFKNKISNQLTDGAGRFETVGKTYLGLDEKDEKPPIGETDATRYKKTFVKLA
jgi:phage gp45-like